ncbi:MAG: MFS transporter [Clostridia bacterium]|nr:MFS transporter [Clostridia bacterium]
MSKKLNFEHTKMACYIAGFTQAVVCGFLPLLFVTFNQMYQIPLTLITLLVAVNFIVQFGMDFAALFFVDKVSYRGVVVAAHILISIGLLLLGTLVHVAKNTYLAIFLATLLFSAGGGLLEVMTSPIMEGCPSKNKAAAMSLLHSMFGFGSVAVVILTNVLLFALGREKWYLIAIVWAFVPALNAMLFSLVPINKIVSDDEKVPILRLFKGKSFLIFLLIMACSGASEIGMSQWASAFAETSLGVSKAVGDILGPCIFALMMALSRLFYAKIADRINLVRYIMICGSLTVVCFLFAALLPFRFAALLACGFCGFTVGIMWPGTLSLAAKVYPAGGATMFGVLALAGDFGCTTGPSIVGFIASMFGGELRTGLLAATVFPLILVLGAFLLIRREKRHPAKYF